MDLSKLTPEQFKITQQCGTEAPFTGEYVDHYESGHYTCVCCEQVLFSSTTKFDSGTGWPSFYDIAKADSVVLIKDKAHGMTRVEVRCKIAMLIWVMYLPTALRQPGSAIALIRLL